VLNVAASNGSDPDDNYGIAVRPPEPAGRRRAPKRIPA